MAAIREVREGAGESIKLMVDFNQGLSLGDALLRCHALDDQSLYWFEEPIVPYDHAGYAKVADELGIRIATGENEYTKFSCVDLISRHGVDVMAVDHRVRARSGQ